MMYTGLSTPVEMLQQIARCAKAKRLSLNYSQLTLSQRSGVSLGVIKKFENSGKISLESILKLSVVLQSLDDFSHVFAPKAPESYASMDELLNEKHRKRGRK